MSLFLLLAAVLCAAPAMSATGTRGTLLLAHGGDAEWNAEVGKVRDALEAQGPSEAAFGMADPAAIQAALDRLEARGAKRVVAVPLFVNSESEVMHQTRYVLGLAEKPSEVLKHAADRMAAAGRGHHGAHGHVHMYSETRAVSRLPLTLTPALDGHPLVERILLARAQALSREPSREVVVLIGHGPVDDSALPRWEKTMARLSEGVRRAGAFRGAAAFTIRDDAAAEVRQAAIAKMRGAVERLSKGGRVLIVPHLIARGGIEKKIPEALAGLDYAWDGKPLLPDPLIAEWAARAAASAPSKDMRLPSLRPTLAKN